MATQQQGALKTGDTFLYGMAYKPVLKIGGCHLSLFFSLLIWGYASAQTTISGIVTDAHKYPVSNVSVIIKNSSEGTLTDSAGHFSFSSVARGSQVLQVSTIGFKDAEKNVLLNDTTVKINFVLSPEDKALDPVVVSAGTFDASDKAKGASLTPIDAVTVAGNGGDIANALRSLPGAQQVGEREGLFVRGGTGDETKQFVDGALLKSPNYGSVPGIPQPARLNPFLFKGILFNTGGYSALYGEALSSALVLQSVDLPDKSSATLHIFPTSVGAGFQDLAANNKGSYGVNLNYGSFGLYSRIVKQKPDFFHAPEYLESDANFRVKTSRTGIVKFYINYGYNRTGMRNTDVDSSSLLSAFETKGTNFYANLSYSEHLGNTWKIDVALAGNYNQDNTTNELENASHQQLFIYYVPYRDKNNETNITSDFAQARIVFTKEYKRSQAIRFGAENFYNNDNYNYNDTLTKVKDNLASAFGEGDVYLGKNIASKIGVRAEYSSLLQRVNIAPRISLAIRVGGGGQFNFAYGIFYQEPETDYVIKNFDIEFTSATHYIINYQKKANNRLFRIEAYYKKYHNLVTTEPVVANDGGGYAKGVEVFFRDKRTFKNLDYWISYTYLDTKRKYLDYPYELRPDFATPHTASMAIKKFFPDANFSANLSYTVATGRPYYDIQTDVSGKPSIMNQGTTNIYSQMNLSFAYLFSLFKKWRNKDFSGIGFGMNNVLGTRQVYGFNYSYGGLNRQPITPPALRSYYIGLFMTFGIDRRDDFINDKL